MDTNRPIFIGKESCISRNWPNSSMAQKDINAQIKLIFETIAYTLMNFERINKAIIGMKLNCYFTIFDYRLLV